jgi:hypothetical protein
MAQTPPSSQLDDVTQVQQTALLRTTLIRIIRYAEQMHADLDMGHLDIAHADQLGRSVLTALREAASISARAELAARSVA